jgi:hypothetical protein
MELVKHNFDINKTEYAHIYYPVDRDWNRFINKKTKILLDLLKDTFFESSYIRATITKVFDNQHPNAYSLIYQLKSTSLKELYTEAINQKLAYLHLTSGNIEKFYSQFGEEGKILLNIHEKYKQYSFKPKSLASLSDAYKVEIDQLFDIERILTKPIKSIFTLNKEDTFEDKTKKSTYYISRNFIVVLIEAKKEKDSCKVYVALKQRR